MAVDMSRLSKPFGTYVYIRSEPGLWTVGFYRPDGKWEPESDHDSTSKAANRVNFLSGDWGGDTMKRLIDCTCRIHRAEYGSLRRDFINFCSLHAAAPIGAKLAEAVLASHGEECDCSLCRLAREFQAKERGE